MAAGTLGFGPFELDLRTGAVLREGEPLALGRRATRLLEAVLVRAGGIATKDELMEAAWPDVIVEEANLTVQISALRSALGPGPDGGAWIATIPRLGYRFVGPTRAPPAGTARPAIPPMAPGPVPGLVRAPAGDDARRPLDPLLVGRAMMIGPTQGPEVFARIVALLGEAIGRDPSSAAAHAALADAYVRDFQNRWSGDPDRALARARVLIDRALELAPQDPAVHSDAALVSSFLKDFARADRELDRARALGPAHPGVLDQQGARLLYAGEPLAAIPLYARALRLDPQATIHWLHMLGLAHFHAEDYKAAAALFRERIMMVPSTDMSRAYLASALGHLGRPSEARRAWTEALEINPAFSLPTRLARQPIRDPDLVGRTLEGARRAGLTVAGQGAAVGGSGLRHRPPRGPQRPGLHRPG